MLGVSDIDIGVAYAIILSFLVIAFAACYYMISRGIGIRD
jgi:hypothetical protein